jgi:hypothetical protein
VSPALRFLNIQVINVGDNDTVTHKRYASVANSTVAVDEELLIDVLYCNFYYSVFTPGGAILLTAFTVNVSAILSLQNRYISR